MHLSRYTKIYPSKDDPESVVLFSTKTAAALLVPAALIKDIETGSLTEEERVVLKDNGFLVASLEREQQEMLGYIAELNALNRSLRYIVVLNLDCNLGCTYCFEGMRKGKHYLSDDVAEQFVALVGRSNLAGKDDVRITFYGGEPLLSIDRIIGISEKVRALAEQNSVRYGFSLVTNGTLLTPDVVRRLVPYGLKSAKVTLDGPEDVHNRFRPFRSGAGSFYVIARNIKDVSSLIRIQIGGNFTRENYREFPRLLDVLAAQGLTPDKIPAIKFDPIVHESREFALPDFHDGCESINEPWLAEASLFLREEILRRGYGTQKVMPSPCLLELEDSLVVNYDGGLYKCPGLIGREECRIGDVRTGPHDYRRSHRLDAWKNDECLACAYLPVCFGGCKYLKLVREGAMDGILCQKPYLDRTLGELIAQDIRYHL